MKCINLIALILVFGCSGQTESNDTILVNDQKLDSIIEDYVDSNKLSGVVVKVMKKNKTLYSKSYGYQDIGKKTPMNINTLFRLASFTKTITSVAAMQLIQAGKLNLEDSVAKFIPEFRDLEVYVNRDSTRKLNKPVTIKHLLMHHSGIGSPFENGAVDKLLRNQSFKDATDLDSFVEEIIKVPLAHQPGESFSYGYSTDVLARVIEIVTGQPIKRYFEENIFTPLKMNNTFFFIPENKKAKLGPAYRIGDNGLEEVVPAGVTLAQFGRGASGLVSTTDDYLNFAMMMLQNGNFEGRQIIKSSTAKLMHTNFLPEDQLPLTVAGTQIIHNGFGLGFATVLDEPEDWQPMDEYNMGTMGNLPGGCYYWLGAYNNSFWIDPNNEIIGIIMTQSVDVGKIAIFQEFYQEFYLNFLPNN